MFDGVFLINSNLNVDHAKHLSSYSNEERFEQTLKTLDSIDGHCKNNLKIIFDTSPTELDKTQTDTLLDRGVVFFHCGLNETVRDFSLKGLRSISETYAFILSLEEIKKLNLKTKRYYKLSGRYELTDNFILNRKDFDDAFVFATSVNSWMDKWIQQSTGAEKVYNLRLWHMDNSLFGKFEKMLPTILSDCLQYSIDVEHSYWKHLHNENVIELPKIGVKGYIAPTGEYIDE